MNTAANIVELLLRTAPELAAQAHRLLSPVADARDELRKHLITSGRIVKSAYAGPPPTSIAAVDGGCVREHLYAADLMVAASTTAQGLTGGDLPLVSHEWAQLLVHESENDRLLSAAMATLELRALAEIQHEFRILDGSFGTPLIALMTALNANSPTVAEAAAALVDDETVSAIGQVCTNYGIVALPKSDSSHAFTDEYKTLFDLHMPGGDKFMATQILEPGEMLYPIPAKKIGQLHVTTPRNATPTVEAAVDRLDAAMRPLRTAAQQRRVLVTYSKPDTADTVVKMEYRVTVPLSTNVDSEQAAIIEGQHIAAILSGETPGPYLQEPFAQHAVDVAAKNVSIGTNAINQAMLALLPAGSEKYIHLLARGYRTS